jgi:O-antigen chain-terminating methyltransferase
VILETPNPTNVVVGSSSFYLDPTHRNPVHPLFLQFLLEARGFVDVELRYLHPSREAGFSLPDDDEPQRRRLVDHLNWAFFGPLDYAVIGRKAKPAP